MTNGNHNLAARVAAATLVAVIGVVGLAAASAALSVSLRETAHACCHTEEADLSCLTLCAASVSDAVLTAADDLTPEWSVSIAESRPEPPLPLEARRDAPASSTADSSPPLYVLHAALLI